MLQRQSGLMEQHNDAMALAERRAYELNAQHPQRSGKGKMGRHKMGLEDMKLKDPEEEEHEVRGKGKPALARLVGGKRPKAKVLEEVGKEALKEHKLQHEALEEEHGGVLARHLMKKYGREHAEKFGRGYMKGMGLSGGNVDAITGAVDTGRVADPPESFKRNTVGMGMMDRHRVPESAGGEYFGSGLLGEDGHGTRKVGGCPPEGARVVGGRKKRAPAGPSDARRRRGQAVSKLMKEKGMSLGEASAYVKQHGY